MITTINEMKKSLVKKTNRNIIKESLEQTQSFKPTMDQVFSAEEIVTDFLEYIVIWKEDGDYVFNEIEVTKEWLFEMLTSDICQMYVDTYIEDMSEDARAEIIYNFLKTLGVIIE